MIRRGVWWLAAALLVTAFSRGEAAAAPRHRNLVLITVDSLRADRLGCYAGDAASSPAIDSLARRGLRFERAYAASPSTAPSVASLMTGLEPARHGLRHDLGGRLAEGVETIATRLLAAGYQTEAVVGTFHLDSGRGLQRGFTFFDDDIKGFRKAMAFSYERRAEEVVGKALQRLEALKRKPFFFWLNLHDPHYDYAPPDPWKGRFEKDPYAGEVAYLDSQIGVLLEGLRKNGLQKKTHIILVASHGEGLGDHQETGHGTYLYETTIRVPLIIAPAGWSIPGKEAPDPRGAALAEAVGLVDLAPTVLEWLGSGVPEGLDGRSFASRLAAPGARRSAGIPPAGLARAGGGEPRRLFAEAVQPHAAYGWSPLFSVIENDRKIVQGERLEAFDLAADPGEKSPLSPVPDWAAALAAEGKRHLGSLEPTEAARRAVADSRLTIPWENSPICVEKMNWPDPRDRVGLNDRLFRIRIAMEQALPGTAAILGEEVLESDPANFTALEGILTLAVRNRWGDAMLSYLEILQCDYPFRGSGYHSFGHYLHRKGDMEQAEKAFLLFARLEPHDREPFHDLAAFYASQGKKDLAFEYLRQAVTLGSKNLEEFHRDGRLAPLKDDPRFGQILGPPPPPRTVPKP